LKGTLASAVLINFLNKTGDGWQVRLEGLWIG